MRIRSVQAYSLAGAALLLGSLLSLFLGLDFGNAGLILQELRIPRWILAVAVGGGLSLSGLLLQTVLGNPLADPYALGVASGAALGAALAGSLRLGAGDHSFGAMAGALVVIALLYRASRGRAGEGDRLLLGGVMMSLLFSGVLSLWMVLADPIGVRALNFWLLGDLGRAGTGSALLVLGWGLICLLWFSWNSRKFDAFLFGDAEVEGFGVPLERMRRMTILLVSILVGLCVSSAGMIGFLGLMIPHFLRKGCGTSLHRHLIPLSYLSGAAFLSAADALARRISEPRELPVGALMVVIGVPVFLRLHSRKSGRWTG
jgi:iron complex transport system permease protein